MIRRPLWNTLSNINTKKSQNCDEFLKAADCICGKRVNLHSSKKKAVLFPLFFWISLIQSRWKYQGWDHLVTLENMAWYPVVSFSLSCLTFNHWWIKPTCCQISVILPKGVTLPEAAMKQNLWELISKVTTRRGNTLYSGKYNKREKKRKYVSKLASWVCLTVNRQFLYQPINETGFVFIFTTIFHFYLIFF